MSRARLVLLACVALSATLAGQLIYNPVAFQFEHDDYAVTTHYELAVLTDPVQDLVPVYRAEVPKSVVTLVPGTTNSYRFGVDAVPAVPVGKTYRAVLYAVGDTSTSFPSNVTPQSFRFNACALAGSAGVQPPALAIPTWPALTAGQGVILDLQVTAPHAVQFLMIDLVGDHAPAWYYVVSVPVGTPSVARVFFGPVTRAGRYEVFARLIDSGGCEATLPFGTFIAVS